MEVLAIIPARGGSKGVPGKNIRELLGKPLIAWTIESAKRSKHINSVIVSTDSEEIATVARTYGAEVPFMRPMELSADATPDLPVFEHALTMLKEAGGYVPDLVVHLWATTPYRAEGAIDAMIQLLVDHPDADAVRSVSVPDFTPFKMWRRDTGPYLEPILKKEYPEVYEKMKEPYAMPRQSLPEILMQTCYGAVLRTSVITDMHSMTGHKILPYYHEPATKTEIDTLADFFYAEYVMKHFLGQNQ